MRSLAKGGKAWAAGAESPPFQGSLSCSELSEAFPGRLGDWCVTNPERSPSVAPYRGQDRRCGRGTNQVGEVHARQGLVQVSDVLGLP